MKIKNIEKTARLAVTIIGIWGSFLLLVLSFFFAISYLYPFLFISFSFITLVLLEMYLRIQHNIDKNTSEIEFIRVTVQNKISEFGNQQERLCKEIIDLLERILEKNQFDNKDILEKINNFSSELNSTKTELSSELNSTKTELSSELNSTKTELSSSLKDCYSGLIGESKAYADEKFENLRAIYNKLGVVIEELVKSLPEKNKF